MDIYEIYESEIKKFTETTAAKKKAEVEAQAKKEQELLKKIEPLLRNSLKEFYTWAMAQVENCPELDEVLKKAIALEAKYDAEYEKDNWIEDPDTMSIYIGSSYIECDFDVISGCKCPIFYIHEFESSDYDTFFGITGLTLSITLMPKIKNHISFEFYAELESSEESIEKKITHQLLKQLATELNCHFEDDVREDWYFELFIDNFNGFNF